MKELICIVCPKGCHLTVDETAKPVAVTGYTCERGKSYGVEEITDPKRVLTTTVRLEGGVIERLPVKSLQPIKKALVVKVCRALDGVTVKSPVHIGDIILKNAADTGADIAATRNL